MDCDERKFNRGVLLAKRDASSPFDAAAPPRRPLVLHHHPLTHHQHRNEPVLDYFEIPQLKMEKVRSVKEHLHFNLDAEKEKITMRSRRTIRRTIKLNRSRLPVATE